jgi:hypothetical protein
MHLLVTEMRRALHRRLVWVLIGLALVMSMAGGLIAFVDSAGGLNALQLQGSEPHPAVMRSWWAPDGGDGWLTGGAFFMLIGGMIGGASVAGAEWRWGTVSTLLTWEPRRTRLLGARLGSAAILAATISFALQVVSLLLLTPAVLTTGSTAGTDLEWWLGLVAAMLRISALTALAAVLGLAIANLGRNTTAALAVICGWLLVVEGLIRALRPGWSTYLLSENLAVVVTWASLEGDAASPTPLSALATLVVYAALPVWASIAIFQRRDLVA